MNMRGKFIRLTVLGIYLLYALLPLLYATRSANAVETAYASPPPSTAGRSIVDKDLLLVPSGDQDPDGPASSAEHVLLKKKRALAPSFNELLPKLISQYAKFSDCEPPCAIFYLLLRSPDNPLNSPTGFAYYHSGVSPPSA
jgi:hypothetical protein